VPERVIVGNLPRIEFAVMGLSTASRCYGTDFCGSVRAQAIGALYTLSFPIGVPAIGLKGITATILNS
jgi:hypothetical protein